MNFFTTLIAGALGLYSASQQRSQARRAAREAQARADRQAANKQAELDRLKSAQRVAYARGGVKLSGTPTVVIDESANQGQLDIDMIKANGQQQVDAYRSQAKQATADGFASLVSRFK